MSLDLGSRALAPQSLDLGSRALARRARASAAIGRPGVSSVTPKKRCVLPGAVPPLASAATATRTACGKSVRVRVLGLPPARWLRLLATPILLASAPPGLEAPSLRTGLVACIVLCCARALKLT